MAAPDPLYQLVHQATATGANAYTPVHNHIVSHIGDPRNGETLHYNASAGAWEQVPEIYVEPGNPRSVVVNTFATGAGIQISSFENLTIKTQDSPAETKDVEIFTGIAGTGTSGEIRIYTNDSAGANTGDVNISTGDPPDVDGVKAGTINIRPGAPGDAHTHNCSGGDVVIGATAASGTGTDGRVALFRDMEEVAGLTGIYLTKGKVLLHTIGTGPASGGWADAEAYAAACAPDDNAIPNKWYVDDAISAGVGTISGFVKSDLGNTVPLHFGSNTAGGAVTMTSSGTGGSVTVSAAGEATFTSSGGDVVISNTSTDGGINLSANSGTIGLSTASGAIIIGAVVGDAVLSSNGGNTTVSATTGTANLTSSAGAANVTGAAGVNVTSSGGDIIVQTTSTGGESVSIEAVNGTVQLKSATGMAAVNAGGGVNVISSDGNINVTATVGNVTVTAASMEIGAPTLSATALVSAAPGSDVLTWDSTTKSVTPAPRIFGAWTMVDNTTVSQGIDGSFNEILGTFVAGTILPATGYLSLGANNRIVYSGAHTRTFRVSYSYMPAAGSKDRISRIEWVKTDPTDSNPVTTSNAIAGGRGDSYLSQSVDYTQTSGSVFTVTLASNEFIAPVLTNVHPGSTGLDDKITVSSFSVVIEAL